MSNQSDTTAPAFLSNIQIVLVEPRVPGNIGAAARAMKTMGLNRMTLVNPVDFRAASGTKWMAHGADDILASARVTTSLEDALDGVVYAVATANRTRSFWLRPVYPIRKAASEIIAAAQQHPTALLFGREDRGLLNHELEMCHLITRIPAACAYPSLNLAQAIMVCAYELFQISQDPPPAVHLDLAEIEAVERVCHRIHNTMLTLGFVSRPEEDTFLRSIRRVFRRSFRLESRDIATLHKLCDQIDYYVKEHGDE